MRRRGGDSQRRQGAPGSPAPPSPSAPAGRRSAAPRCPGRARGPAPAAPGAAPRAPLPLDGRHRPWQCLYRCGGLSVASATHRSTVAARALRQAKECRQQAALRDKATCRVGRGQTTAKLRRTGPHVLPHRRTAAEPESRQRTVTGRSSVAGREQRLPAVQDVLGGIRGAGQRGERPLPAAQAGELRLDGLHALQDSSQPLCMTLHVSMVMYIFP